MEQSQTYLDKGRIDEALDLCNRAALLTEDESIVAKRYEETGDVLMLLGEFGKAKECFQKGIRLLV